MSLSIDYKFFYVYKKLCPHMKHTFWYARDTFFKCKGADKEKCFILYYNIFYTKSIVSNINALYDIIHEHGVKTLLSIIDFFKDEPCFSAQITDGDKILFYKNKSLTKYDEINILYFIKKNES